MATQPTNLPVPSESPRDLKFNAGKIDEFVTSLVNTYVDRFGNEHYTIEGLRWLAQQAIAQYGWILVDSFQDGADITLPNQALRDEDTGEYYRWDGALPKHVNAGSTPATSGGVGVGAWIGIGDASLRAMLATVAGAGMVGAADKDGNPSTVQAELDDLHDALEEQSSELNERIQYLYNDSNIVYSSELPNYKYAAFCDSCMVLGTETYVHRASSIHTDDGGGKSSIILMQKINGELITKYIIPPEEGKDFRDPSITYDHVSRTVAISVEVLDVTSGTYGGGRVYILSAGLSYLTVATVNAPGYFQWGKVLRTPSGQMMVAAYSTTAGNVGIFTATGTFSAPGSFSLTTTLFTDDVTVFRNEVSIFYWKEFLVAAARTQLVSDQTTQALSYTYTRDLTGATGWVTGGRLPSGTSWVAPRLTEMRDGALCFSGGSISSGFRGSVAASITYDLSSFSTPNTIFTGSTGNGGYHGLMNTEKGLSIYTYVETSPNTKADTFLSYRDPSIVQMLKRPLNYPLRFFSANNVTYIGDQPFGTTATTTSGYVTFFLKETVNNCRGLVLNLGGSTGSSVNVLLKRQDGTIFVTLGGVNVTATGTYYASHAGINIPSGVYQVSIAGAYVCTGARKNSTVISYPSERVYGLVDVNGVAAGATSDVFIGFAV